MAAMERSVYFYKVEMLDDGQGWLRADVLNGLAALSGEDRMLALGDDAYAWVQVDRIPRGRQTGRLRLFRDRRANLPGYALNFVPNELPIPAEAGLIEPTHVVLSSNGLIAAEYNHFAPRIPSAFATLLRLRLGLSLRIGTYVQADIIEQLDRLRDIRLLELSMVPTPELEAELRNAGKFGVAVAELSEPQGGRRVHLNLSGDRSSRNWTEQARGFAKRVLSISGDRAGEETKVLRVTGFDPVANGVETVDLLKQKLVRRVEVVRDTERSKVLNVSSAYTTIEEGSERGPDDGPPASCCSLLVSATRAWVRKTVGVLFVDWRGWTEMLLAAALIAAYFISTDIRGFQASMTQGARTALYATLAGISGALLGFVLAALAVLVALPVGDRIQALRGHPKWPRVPSAYVRASLALLAAVIVCTFGIVLDGGPAARQGYEAVTVAIVSFALVRVLASIVVLDQILSVASAAARSGPTIRDP